MSGNRQGRSAYLAGELEGLRDAWLEAHSAADGAQGKDLQMMRGTAWAGSWAPLPLLPASPS